MNLVEFDYINALYRKDNKGNISLWYAQPDVDGLSNIHIFHGILGCKIQHNILHTSRLPKDEIQSRINAKRKTGYKFLSEIRDNNEIPRREMLDDWLKQYLPEDRTNSEGYVLPMLAKVYDNENNKLFKKNDHYIGQWKINGLRCFISAYKEQGLFGQTRLMFQSREGVIWNSLLYLENNLLAILPRDLIDKMVYESFVLDGEVYIPGYSVNEINHAVKDPNCPENKLVQFWWYDIAVPDYTQIERIRLLHSYGSPFMCGFGNKAAHLSHKCTILALPSININNGDEALSYRDRFIDLGFEGLILRKPDEEYQFGKRNSTMIKYKRTTDGIFEILDIYPEGSKRGDLPLFKCKNDINDATFEVHINGTFEEQTFYLNHRDEFIGRKLYITYGERSGVNMVPFHTKEVRLY